MGSKSKGDRYERRLVIFLDAAGFAVMRAPSSGSATERDLPDVYAVRDGERLALEVKYIGEDADRTYLDGEEVDALERFADLAGATPLVVSRRWRDPRFCLYRPRELPETDGGHYRIDEDVEADPLEELADGSSSDALRPTDLADRRVVP